MVSELRLTTAPAPTSASTTRSSRFEREPLTSTHTSRVSSALTARASASVSANHSRARAEGLDREPRQLAGGEQAVDAVTAREAADLAMTLVGEARRARPCRPCTSQRRASTPASTSMPAFIELGIRVVRVVDDPGATGRGFELQSARNRAHCGEPGAHVIERGAGRMRGGRGAQRVHDVVSRRRGAARRASRPAARAA